MIFARNNGRPVAMFAPVSFKFGSQSIAKPWIAKNKSPTTNKINIQSETLSVFLVLIVLNNWGIENIAISIAAIKPI